MSCQNFVPVCLPGAEAEGLASPPWSLGSLEQCDEHRESLSMFCLDDLEPSCKQCAAVSHAGHRVYPLTEAVTDCKEELTTSLNGLKEKMSHFEKVTWTCEHTSRHNRAEAKMTEEHIKKDFDSLHQFLRDEEAARLLALREKQKEKKKEVEDRIDRMNQVITSLEQKIRLIEEELDAGGDGVEFLEHYPNTKKSTWPEPQGVCSPLIDVAKHLGNLQCTVWKKMKDVAPYTPVTLDPRTAGQSLRVSSRLNSVHITPGPSQGLEQSLHVPAIPERFHPYSCILAREGFDSGVHSWDIEFSDTNNWTVGVAAQSVSRKAEFEACPEAGLWCISLRDGEYRALTTPSRALSLGSSQHLSRVHVTLNWDKKTLEFKNADTDAHLFTFRHYFSEKVYPYFETISLCGGFAVLEQRVNVSVSSDHVPVEDVAITEGDQLTKSESCTEGDINTASNNNNSKMSERRLTEDKSSVICSVREKKTKPVRCSTKDQLIKSKASEKEKTKNNKSAVKKQSSKPRFSVTYHVSLNRALNIIDKQSCNHEQIQINHVDHLVRDPHDK